MGGGSSNARDPTEQTVARNATVSPNKSVPEPESAAPPSVQPSQQQQNVSSSGSTSQLKASGSGNVGASPQTKLAKKSSLRFKPLRQRIFEKAANEDTLNDKFETVKEMDDETVEFLHESFENFFFLQTAGGGEGSKIENVIHSMEREEVEAGHSLIVEGESGDRLFVIETGELEVTINGEFIRKLGRGNIVGELSLLYESPRSATVRAISAVVVWSLKREVFRRIQVASANNEFNERARSLIRSPELAVLSAMNLSKLVGLLQVRQFTTGEYLYKENELVNSCMIMEKGTAKVLSTVEKLKNQTTVEVDAILGITRPNGNIPKKASSAPTNKLPASLNYVGVPSAVETRTGARAKVSQSIDASMSKEIVVAAQMAAAEPAINPQTSLERMAGEEINKQPIICYLDRGCLIGIEAFKSKAKLAEAWEWVTEEVASAGEATATSTSVTGARCPCSVVAAEPVQVLLFTVETFESVVGPVSKFLHAKGVQTRRSSQVMSDVDDEEIQYKEREFDSWRFTVKATLGSGTFGVVTLAEYRDEQGQVETTMYALKSLSKSVVVETGQVRHVLDERRLLSTMSSVFILRLYGTYQTPHNLVMVTEALSGGDLWCVVYETYPYCDIGGLTIPLARFYSASVILALGHIHAKGIVYRDLKPENVMLDSRGYLKVIDFGFAKRVPYTKTDVATGEEKVFPKTYTLCGTPEYLSPELIFNLGHDQASDLWALGVLIHEMVLATTPFAPKKADNVTELFTNIAMVKRNGLNLSPKLADKDKVIAALVTNLLNPEASERIQAFSGSTVRVLDHPFFSALDIPGLKKGDVKPEYVPPLVDYSQFSKPAAPLQPRPFHGDQSIFEEF